MSDRRIKQELLSDNHQRSSPTIPNTSSRAQNISSAAPTPAPSDPQTATQGARHRSSPTFPDSSSRAQTDSSTTQTPAPADSPMANQGTSQNSDTTMTGVDHREHDAMHSLGAHSHRLIQGIKKLEDLNISATLKSLPKFVVVGDQSAGKSSIVEALCDISLPRSQGTCTRCPFLITTSSQLSSHAPAWTCSISIKEGNYFSPEQGKFVPRPKMISTHFATITDKNELEPLLRKAQLAVLNPRKAPQSYVSIDLGSADLSLQVAFSPNVVCLDIQSAHLPELAFYDLPGSINVIEDGEDPLLVTMIEELISYYLRDEQCLVLLAIGAESDVETSTTFRFIKKCNAVHRCAGVLTKADLLQPGKEGYIQQLLDGQKFKLGKGWFITKQLSQAQIEQGISHAEARDLEADFFRQEPWSSLRDLQRFCGIPRLQEAVSRSLTDHIRGELPEFLGRVDDRLKEVSDELIKFPERPADPKGTVSDEIKQVSSTLAKFVNGDDGFNALIKLVESVMRDFKRRLGDVKPQLNHKTPGYQAPTISLDDDDEPPTPTPIRAQMPVRSSATPSSSRKRPAEATPTHHRRIKRDPAEPAVEKRVYTLDGLRHEYEQGNISGFENAIDIKVTNKLVLETLQSWNDPVQRLLQSVGDAVRKFVREEVDKVLSVRRANALYDKTQNVLDSLITRLLQETVDRVNHILTCEQYKPRTLGKFTAIRSRFETILKADRLLQRTNEYFDTREATMRVQATSKEKRAELAKKQDWCQANLGDDDWVSEIQCAAHILAYYDTAAGRFADTVYLHFEYDVLRPLGTDVLRTLKVDLEADNAEVCAELLAADPARERQRTQLLDEQKKLQDAMTELEELQAWEQAK